ncbi:hypothetical protein T459_01961 [Capsicum annuum]|uniref:Uncharacterized protein n=1 Tax=Capsicum annuum TaxID=4072 RepID=A0A2G3AIL0_CAPAN|nr:hypothetical protein T459_01961 [Capsicum annuum]
MIGDAGGVDRNGNTIIEDIFGRALHRQVKYLAYVAESNKVDEIMEISLELDKNIKEFRKRNTNIQIEGNYVHLEMRKHDEEIELVKDVASMKAKISELQRKLTEVSNIKKVMKN